jgi:hypothetical protein
MQTIFEVTLLKPSSWTPPYVEESEEESEVPLRFRLVKGDGEHYYYLCLGCLSAGGEIEDIFQTSLAEESEWPCGDGVPVRMAHEMYDHGRQHEIIWRWSLNRIPPQKLDK